MRVPPRLDSTISTCRARFAYLPSGAAAFSAVCWLFGREISTELSPSGEVPIVDVFATDDEGDLDLGDPDFDVPSFLK